MTSSPKKRAAFGNEDRFFILTANRKKAFYGETSLVTARAA